MKWRPIKTAPKDWVKFDVWTSDGRRLTDCEHNEMNWGYDIVDDCGASLRLRRGITPTHWMIVLPPPQALT